MSLNFFFSDPVPARDALEDEDDMEATFHFTDPTPVPVPSPTNFQARGPAAATFQFTDPTSRLDDMMEYPTDSPMPLYTFGGGAARSLGPPASSGERAEPSDNAAALQFSFRNPDPVPSAVSDWNDVDSNQHIPMYTFGRRSSRLSPSKSKLPTSVGNQRQFRATPAAEASTRSQREHTAISWGSATQLATMSSAGIPRCHGLAGYQGNEIIQFVRGCSILFARVQEQLRRGGGGHYGPVTTQKLLRWSKDYQALLTECAVRLQQAAVALQQTGGDLARADEVDDLSRAVTLLAEVWQATELGALDPDPCKATAMVIWLQSSADEGLGARLADPKYRRQGDKQPGFWEALTSAVMRGHLKVAADFLQGHSQYSAGDTRTPVAILARLLREAPLLEAAEYGDVTVRQPVAPHKANQQKIRHWQTLCREHTGGWSSNKPETVLLEILLGNEEALNAAAGDWRELLSAHLLFREPRAGASDVLRLLKLAQRRKGVGADADSTEDDKVLPALRAAMSGELDQVFQTMREIGGSTVVGILTQAFLAHLAEALLRDEVEVNLGRGVSSQALCLQAAEVVGGLPGGWRLARLLADESPEGPSLLSGLVGRLNPDTDEETQAIVDWAQEAGMAKEAEGLCARRGAYYLAQGGGERDLRPVAKWFAQGNAWSRLDRLSADATERLALLVARRPRPRARQASSGQEGVEEVKQADRGGGGSGDPPAQEGALTEAKELLTEAEELLAGAGTVRAAWEKCPQLCFLHEYVAIARGVLPGDREPAALSAVREAAARLGSCMDNFPQRPGTAPRWMWPHLLKLAATLIEDHSSPGMQPLFDHSNLMALLARANEVEKSALFLELPSHAAPGPLDLSWKDMLRVVRTLADHRTHSLISKNAALSQNTALNPFSVWPSTGAAPPNRASQPTQWSAEDLLAPHIRLTTGPAATPWAM